MNLHVWERFAQNPPIGGFCATGVSVRALSRRSNSYLTEFLSYLLPIKLYLLEQLCQLALGVASYSLELFVIGLLVDEQVSLCINLCPLLDLRIEHLYPVANSSDTTRSFWRVCCHGICHYYSVNTLTDYFCESSRSSTIFL